MQIVLIKLINFPGKPHFLAGYPVQLYMWYRQGKVALCLIQYRTINTHVEPSLTQTQYLQTGLTHTAADGEFVG
jgi:hypothetical protein